MERFLGPYTATLHAVLRIVAGFLFFQHGLPKLFGGFGSRGPVELFSQMGLAGIIEVFGGAAIALGLFDQPGRFHRRRVRWRSRTSRRTRREASGRSPTAANWPRSSVSCSCYFAATGAGKWSLDALRKGGRR